MTLRLRPAIQDITETIHSLSFSPDAQVLAAGLSDGSVQLLNVASGRHLYKMCSAST